jgi:hypothetical protein
VFLPEITHYEPPAVQVTKQRTLQQRQFSARLYST